MGTASKVRVHTTLPLPHCFFSGLADFHTCQKRVGLAENSIPQDVKTRWRTAYQMAEAIVYNKSAVLEMDKDPKYKDPGETWGKNKLNFVNWDQIEEGGACLFEAAQGSQLLEGDKYPTSPLVVPTAFRLMAYSASSHDVYFQNRDEDEFNDDASNPVIVRHAHLNDKIRLARQLYHERLVSRFDTELPLPVKKFFFVSSMLDPRFKKLQFDGDDMLSAALRRSAIRWLTEEYNANYKGKVYDPDSPAPDSPAPDAAVNVTPPHDHQKRRKISAAGFFTPRVAGSASNPPPSAPPVAKRSKEDTPHIDELKTYLALPQIEYQTEWDALEWWKENASKFPNLSRMAKQYLGCPASSATVERLFSLVGIAFSQKRKSATSGTIADLMFARMMVD
tara:strand:- start:176 stop:1351 length:1176 start_codon:yes stop_codon:yes gene_type:complete